MGFGMSQKISISTGINQPTKKPYVIVESEYNWNYYRNQSNRSLRLLGLRAQHETSPFGEKSPFSITPRDIVGLHWEKHVSVGLFGFRYRQLRQIIDADTAWVICKLLCYLRCASKTVEIHALASWKDWTKKHDKLDVTCSIWFKDGIPLSIKKAIRTKVKEMGGKMRSQYNTASWNTMGMEPVGVRALVKALNSAFKQFQDYIRENDDLTGLA